MLRSAALGSQEIGAGQPTLLKGRMLEKEQMDELLTLFSGISGRAKVGGWKLALCSRYKGKLLI